MKSSNKIQNMKKKSRYNKCSVRAVNEPRYTWHILMKTPPSALDCCFLVGLQARSWSEGVLEVMLW